MTPLDGADLHEEPYTTQLVLSDGGVYDNLGLETVWKRYKTVLVSDAGGRMAAEPDPKARLGPPRLSRA
jgi:NTE family protein